MKLQQPLIILICLFILCLSLSSCKKDDTTDPEDTANSDILKPGSGFKVAARLKDGISKPEGTITAFKTLDFSVTADNRLHWFFRGTFFGSPPPKAFFRVSFDLATGDTVTGTREIDENTYEGAKYQPGSNVLYKSASGFGVPMSIVGDVQFQTQLADAGVGLEIAYNGDIMFSGFYLNGVDGLGQQRYQLYANNWHNGVHHGFYFERRSDINDPNGTVWVGSKAEVIDNNGTMVVFAYKQRVLYAYDETEVVLDSIALPDVSWIGGYTSDIRVRTSLDESKVIIAVDFTDGANARSLNTFVYNKQNHTLSLVVADQHVTDYSGDNWDADDDGAAYYLSGGTGALKLNKATANGVTQIGSTDFAQQNNEPTGVYIRNNHVYLPTTNFAIFEPK